MERKQFSVIDALTYGFNTFGNNLGLFLLTNFIVLIAYYVATFLMSSPLILGIFGSFGKYDIMFIVFTGTMMLISALVATLCFVVFQKMLLDFYDTGTIHFEVQRFTYLLPLIGRLLVVNMPQWLFLGIGGLLGAILYGSAGCHMAIMSAVLLLLTLLCIVGWLYVATRLQFAVYAVIDKKISVMEAWKLSWAMTRHNIVHSFGLLLCCWIMYASMLKWFLGSPTLLAQVWAYRKLAAQE